MQEEKGWSKLWRKYYFKSLEEAEEFEREKRNQDKTVISDTEIVYCVMVHENSDN